MKKILLFLGLAFFMGAFIFAVDAYLDAQEDQAKLDAYARLIPLIGLESSDNFETQADKVRQFIFAHTRYSVDDDFYKIWGNAQLTSESILKHANGTAEKRAPLECSARTGVMENIFITLGYNVRSISAYKNGKNFTSHAFSEVQNPGTGAWHTQDAQYNIYWRVKKTGARASIEDIIASDFEDIEPCISPDQCGWDLPNRENNFAKDLKPKLGLAAIKDSQRKKRPLYVNARRFDLDEPQIVKGGLKKTYCEHIPKNCREEIIIFE